MRKAKRAGLLAAALIAFLAPATGSAPQLHAASLEYPIKAAFLYKFAPFVQWPTLPSGNFTICVAGHDPFGVELDNGVKDLTVDGRTIRIQRLDAVQPGTSCQILYVAGSPTQSVQQALDLVHDRPVLTVTEKAGIGSVIQFVIDNNRVRFDIDTDAAKAHGLVVSSKLLSLARVVRPSRGE
jgi:hypothetical protein